MSENSTHGKPDTWDERDGGCTYCGSLRPDIFMERLRKGDVSLCPTDKNYKVYIRNKGGEPFRQSYRIDKCETADRAKWVWTTDEVDEMKFYFEHLSEDQKKEFIVLMNDRKISLDFPGYFYRMPFFCGSVV